MSRKIPGLRETRSGNYWEPPRAVRRITGEDGNPIWRGQTLSPEIAQARKQAEKCNADLQAWKEARALDQEHAARIVARFDARNLTFSALCNLFRREDNPAWSIDISERTRRDYRQRLKKLELEFGDTAMKQITSGMIKRYYDRIRTDRPSEANHRLAAMSAACSWGAQTDLLTHNPVATVRKRGTPPRKSLMETFELDAIVAAADRMGRHSMGTAAIMAFALIQRGIDIRLMKLENRQAGRWTFIQTKTRAGIDVAEPAVIAARLDAIDHPGGGHVIVSEETGDKYSEYNFQQWATRVIREAINPDPKWTEGKLPATPCPSLHGKWFSDLRRSGFVHLARLGYSAQHIRSISGHSSEEANKMIDTYCPIDPQMADNAMQGMTWKTTAY